MFSLNLPAFEAKIITRDGKEVFSMLSAADTLP